MENPQMGMPAEMAPQGPSPEEMAIYDQMRQQISPQEFSNEMLAGASQVDPQAVAEFTEELQSLDVSPEELDALNDLVDQILASPEQYDQLRQQYLAQGMPDDILPEQFDPYFFAALNMAVDQMIAAPTGVQAFAEGGIAELKPIAKAIASYGRNGDTMLAHITPAEARMLKRRGGSGTINPATGLPEFFLKKAFKSIGKAVKKFAQSSIGRIVLPIALGFFLGPAAASVMGVGAGTAAGLAVSGFVGGAGSTLLAGGNLKDALKAGAVGGVLAGAGGVLSGAQLTGAATMTPGQALQSRVDQFTGMFKPGAPVQASVPQAGGAAEGLGPNQAPTPDAGRGLDISSKKVGVNLDGTRVNALGSPNGALPPADVGSSAYDLNMQAQQAARTGSTFDPRNALTDNVTTGAQRDAYMANQGLNRPPSLIDQAKDFYTRNTPTAIREAGAENAIRAVQEKFPGVTPAQVAAAPAGSPMALAYKAALPGVFQTYGPTMAAGLGIMGLAGGFDTKPVQGGPITQSLMKPVTQRIAEDGTQRQMYMQGLPGVVYDEFGAPVFGKSTRLPTYDVPDYNYGGFNMPSAVGPGSMELPSVYTTPSGSFGSRQVAQPYNTASMYTNLMPPQRYADGGQVQYFDEGGSVTPGANVLGNRTNQKLPANFNWEKYVAANPDLARAGIDTQTEAQEHWLNSGLKENRVLSPEEAASRQAAKTATADAQLAARTKVAQNKALRRSQGSGTMYANINAGISALAPEANPMDAADTTFGARNRQAQLANLQQTYAPMLEGQRSARVQQAQALGQVPGPMPSPLTATPQIDRYSQMVQDQYARIGRTGFGGQASQIDVPGFTGFVNQLQSGQIAPSSLPGAFDVAVQNYMRDNPNDRYTEYVRQFQGTQPPAPVSPPPAAGLPNYFQQNPDVAAEYQRNTYGLSPEQFAQTHFDRYGRNEQRAAPSVGQDTKFMNMGGIAALGQGGYPRRTGQISGPGTEKSDSIPAMLSDGEFVMTAKAVRGAGKGNRRAGAKQMYKLMHQLEKNSERG